MRYVSYGSNLLPLRLQQRTPSARLLGTAEVPGMSLRFHKRGNLDRSAKCNLIPCKRSVAHVAVYELHHSEIHLLDLAEGAGNGYDRSSLPVDGFGECFTYFAAPTHIDESLVPFCWYKALVLTGCEYHDFPEAYTDRIGALETARDPDDGRHEVHMELIDRALNGA